MDGRWFNAWNKQFGYIFVSRTKGDKYKDEFIRSTGEAVGWRGKMGPASPPTASWIPDATVVANKNSVLFTRLSKLFYW